MCILGILDFTLLAKKRNLTFTVVKKIYFKVAYSGRCFIHCSRPMYQTLMMSVDDTAGPAVEGNSKV